MSDKKIALGCSHTFGIGVEKHEAWPALLGAVNYGVNGASSDLIARTLPDILEKEQPNTVYILWPDWSRFEYLKNGRWIQSHPTDPDRLNFMETHPEEWLRNNFAQKVKDVKQMCDDQNIKLHHMTLYDIIPYHDHADRWPLSKLGHHYSPEWHQWIANLFRTHNEFPIAYD